MPGLLAILVSMGAGYMLAGPVLRLGGRFENVLIGAALAVPLFLLPAGILLRLKAPLQVAVHAAPWLMAMVVLAARKRPDAPRFGPELSCREKGGLLIAMLFVWLFLNMMQVINVDDDYWLHTPVQGRMLRGVIPPTNPFFPDLVLNGHFGRDTLVVATSLCTGRDVFGSQVLLSSFCHSLGLAILYLALRRSGSAASATGGTFMAWLGMNVAHRVGLLDFYQNNGPPTYLTLALLVLLFCELWQRPGRKLALVCGAVLGVYAQIYETHFGLVVLTVLSMQPFLARPARKPSVLALGTAAVLALTGSTAIAQLVQPKQPTDNAIANQSQSVDVSFPKSPFLCLRIDIGDLHPISIGYRAGLGASLLKAIDRETSRVNSQYVRLWSWEVMRMHWLAVWLAPLSAWLVLRARDRAGGFLWLFGAWAFLIPGMLDFGPIHEYEWYRWEFAAGYGLAAAFGAGLGALVRGRPSGLAVAALLLLQSRAGLNHLRELTAQFANPRPVEVLGLRFDSRDWLLRHGGQLRLDASDLRIAAWVKANPQVGRGAFIYTSGLQHGWGILFESTLMALVDLQALGHRLPTPDQPVGVPPFQFSDAFLDFLSNPVREQARTLGIDWMLLRSSDVEADKRMMKNLTLVAIDSLSQDGNVRLLLQSQNMPLRTPRLSGDVDYRLLDFKPAPAGCVQMQITFLNRNKTPLLAGAILPVPSAAIRVAVPKGCAWVEVLFLEPKGTLERRLLPVDWPTPTGG